MPIESSFNSLFRPTSEFANTSNSFGCAEVPNFLDSNIYRVLPSEDFEGVLYATGRSFFFDKTKM